jgi:23S rRNA (cytidine1920-2'-O)/16S rRNA (cytidine1409-2'-O)-methyltransferase
MRLDLYLVETGYFKSRSRAQSEIKDGHIKVNGKTILKSSFEIEDGKIEVINPMPYVSRGGLKLLEAITKFNLDFKDKVVLDIGASTGGFTDVALKHGASLVYAVDVGSLQLDESLRVNPSVKSFENTNILDTNFNVSFDALVMDVSFVTIEKLIPSILKYLNANNYLVCLIKPQFEYGKFINKGIIKDKKIHLEVLNKVENALNLNNMHIDKIIPSPIKGGSGNIEFLSIIKIGKSKNLDFTKVVDEAHRRKYD